MRTITAPSLKVSALLRSATPWRSCHRTRRLLGLIEGHVQGRAEEAGTPREAVRFTRRALREALGWGDTQLKVHLARLVELELVWAHRGPHGSHLYELAWEGGSEAQPQLPGLNDPEALAVAGRRGYDSDRSGPKSDRSGPKSDRSGARSARGRGAVGGRSASTGGGRLRCQSPC
jgi:hypothetical protein